MIAADETWLPAAFSAWMPVTQATVLGLATFAQEDLPTVTAAALAVAGKLSLWTGFIGCFLGIWLGDILLYLAARGLGRPALAWSWTRKWVSAERVAQSEQWFASKGAWLLISSRFVPGMRLPTYLAAGLLRVSAWRFVAITGVVVAVWTTLIFGLAQFLGARFGDSLRSWNRSGWALLALIAMGFLLIKLFSRWIGGVKWRRIQTSIDRWARYEFWPAWLFYLPVGIQYIRLSLRYRSWTLPASANPGIPTGGLVGESKFEILQQMQFGSPAHIAESWLLRTGTAPERIEALTRVRAENGIEYPFILKPDVGQRGAGVKLIRDGKGARECLLACEAPMVVQRYAAGPFEAGVFYYRFPGEEKGRVFAITEKVFPEVEGDGQSTLEELIWQDDRARFVADRYLARLGDRRTEILPVGTTVKLVEAGNHAQGCIFRDGARWLTPELEDRIDEISRKVDGFYIGRYDIRFASEADFRSGKEFQIIELNGASSEATSIYDSRNSIVSAYRTLFRQWELVFAIGAANRQKGVPSLGLSELLQAWKANRRLVAAYPIAD